MTADILMPLAIDDITIPEGRREIDTAAVKRLADSIDNIGLKHPITVKRRGDKYTLVAGLHRIEAHKKLGLEHIPCCIVSMTSAEARMWEIAENLHRAELTKLQRAEQIEEWRALKGAQVAHPQPHDRGVSQTAEALGVSRREVQRAEKIASLTPEAKQAAVDVGIADNQSALLAVANKPTAAEQVQTAAALAALRGMERRTIQGIPLPPGMSPKIIARWDRFDDAITIAKIVLATLKYEPHGKDIEPLRKVLSEFVAGIPAFLDRRGGA